MIYPSINYARLTTAELAFVQNFAGLPYANGDLLYYNSGLTRLPKGSDGQSLTLVSGLPAWGSLSVSGLTPGGILFGASDGTITQDDASLHFDDSTNRLGFLTTAPTHTLTLGSTSTGIAVYNTSDQTTNYERLRTAFASNVLTMLTEAGGTGTVRSLRVGSSTSYIEFGGTASPWFQFVRPSASGASNFITTTSFSLSSASVAQTVLNLPFTVAQSGSGGYTGLVINATESSTGSGTKLLIDLQVSSSSKFKIDNSGHLTAEGVTSTGATGSGKFVFDTSPTLVTPVIGAATGTSVALAGAAAISSFSNTSDTASLQVLKLIGARATPAVNDEIYQSFYLNNSVGTSKEFARITLGSTNVTNTTEAGALKFYVISAGTLTERLQLLPSAIRPQANDGLALGGTANNFSDLFLASGGVINWNNGNLTLTHAANLLTLAGGQFTFGANTAYFTETDNGNSSTAKTITWTASNKQKLTLTGNCTLTFTAPGGPCNLILKLVQDGSGSRTVTWPATVHWTGGTAPTLTTTAGQIDIVALYYDGTNYYGSSSLNYSP